MTFADHHRYSASDVAAIAAKLQSAGADAVFTTDKDAVRFEALGALPFPLYRVPLMCRIRSGRRAVRSIGGDEPPLLASTADEETRSSTGRS